MSDLMLIKSYEVAHDLGDWYECELISDDVKLLLDKIKKLEQENKMMRECLELIENDKYEATPWIIVETNSAKKAKECLEKLRKGEK